MREKGKRKMEKGKIKSSNSGALGLWKSRSRLAVRNFARQTGTGGKRNGLVASLRAASFGPKLLTGHEPAVVGHVVRVSGLRDIELRHVARCASNVTYNSKSTTYDMG